MVYPVTVPHCVEVDYKEDQGLSPLELLAERKEGVTLRVSRTQDPGRKSRLRRGSVDFL